MPQWEEDLWMKVVKRLKVNKHPKNLPKGKRKIQLLLLLAMSSDRYNLPKNDKWERWFYWHEEKGRRNE